jgi:protein-S-isoprenylcysteine O-methyltransferase Ste14
VSRPRFGARGESYVIAQFVLMLVVIAAPAQVRGWPGRLPPSLTLDVVVVASVVAGVVLLTAGTRGLGRNLTPLPYPKDNGVLVDRGIYTYVRHPIYGGLILVAFGWSLRRGGGLVLLYATLLAGLLYVKSRREEGWLTARFPAYTAYRARTRRFLPFVW